MTLRALIAKKPGPGGLAALGALALALAAGSSACAPSAGRNVAISPTGQADIQFVRNTTEAGKLVSLLSRGDVAAVADRFHYPPVASSDWIDELHDRVAADLYVALAGFGTFSDAALFTDARELAWIEIHSVNRGYWAALGVRSMYVVTHAVDFMRLGPGFVQIFFHDTGAQLEIAWIQFAVDKAEQGLIERTFALAPADAIDSTITEADYWTP